MLFRTGSQRDGYKVPQETYNAKSRRVAWVNVQQTRRGDRRWLCPGQPEARSVSQAWSSLTAHVTELIMSDAGQESFRCIARPNSSSASILLLLFLHLNLFALFSTSLQDYWWNWNGWWWTNTKDDSIHPDSCWARFAIAAVQAVELKWLMLNKDNKWFHWTRVTFPLVSMSASWFLVSMYLISIFGSRFIRSKNQSSATLWVLETCLIVGLLPLMIILITASLSSNTYNKASWCENWTFEGTQSMWFNTLVFPWDRLFGPWSLSQFTTGRPDLSAVWVVFLRTETIRSHNSRASKPSNLNSVSKEIISDSVELCGTAVCFLHIQLIGTNVWLPKTHNVPPEVDLESSRSPAKSESWNSPSLHCFAVPLRRK